MQNLAAIDSQVMGTEERIETKDVSSGLVKPIFIGVTGGTASGKTSLCKRIG